MVEEEEITTHIPQIQDLVLEVVEVVLVLPVDHLVDLLLQEMLLDSLEVEAVVETIQQIHLSPMVVKVVMVL